MLISTSLKTFVFEDDLISAGKNHGGFSSCFFFVDFAEKQYQFFQLRVLNI